MPSRPTDAPARRRAATVAAVLGALGLAGHAAAVDPGFSISQILADGQFNNRTSTAVDSAGVTHTAFMTQFGTDDSSKEIVYGNNEGGSWTFTPITENTPVRHELPSLTLDNDENVHIAWHQGVAAGGNELVYVNNIDGSFDDIITLTDPGYVIPEIRVDGDDVVHLVCRSQTLGTVPEDIYYFTWSADAGASDPVNISNTPAVLSWEPQLAIDSQGAIHIVYEDQAGAFGGELVYRNNTSGTFEEVATTVTGTVSSPMLLIAADDVVSILYRQDNRLHAIDDGGTGAFSQPEPLFVGVDALPAFYERFAIDDDGHRHVAFASNVGDLRGIYYIGEDENGWGDPVYLDGDDTGNQGVSIGLNSSGDVTVTYSLSGFDTQVFADVYAATGSLDAAPIPGDLTGDGTVGGADLGILLSEWGPCDDCHDCPADLNDDCTVGGADLGILLSNWTS